MLKEIGQVSEELIHFLFLPVDIKVSWTYGFMILGGFQLLMSVLSMMLYMLLISWFLFNTELTGYFCAS